MSAPPGPLAVVASQLAAIGPAIPGSKIHFVRASINAAIPVRTLDGVAVVTQPDRLAVLNAAWERAGHRPIEVDWDGGGWHLEDGNHRLFLHRAKGIETIRAHVSIVARGVPKAA